MLAEYEVFKVLMEAGATAELDAVALTLQNRIYSKEFEPKRLEMIDMVKAKGAKIRYSANNPNTPQVTHPALTAEEAQELIDQAAKRRQARGQK
jgi:hypothetical protein